MPKHNAKRVAEKLQTVVNAWKTLRPTKLFAGMTLEQFQAQVQPSLAARDQLTVLSSQATDSRVQRHQSDSSSMNLVQLVVNAIKGDVEEGENSPLYAAMGYVPKSNRRSGLTRKGLTTPSVQTVVVK